MNSPLIGSVDDVSIYSTALSAGQVKAHYEAASKKPPKPKN